MKRRLLVALAALLCVSALGLAACGGAPSSASPGADTAKLLMKDNWTCSGAVSASDGKTHELHDVLNAYVMMISFFDEDEARVYVDTDFTILKWRLDGNEVTMSGDGTYRLTLQDDGAKLVWSDFQGTGYDLEFVQGDS